MFVEMASSEEPSCCESDPNFAIICAFLEKFGVACGLNNIDFLELQAMLENTQEVPQMLVDLHIKLLRKARKSVSNERWERAIIKFCHTFCTQDAWEFERFGYKKARISSKLRVLKELLELQFDTNGKFKTEINKMTAQDLRSQPLGKDKSGHSYWFQSDENYQIRVYKEDLDEETWTLVAKDRDGLVTLINELGGSDGDSKLSSEDSNSLTEKPIIDTGQITNSSENSKKSLDEDDEDSNDLKSESKSSDDKEENPAKKLKIDVSEAIEDPVVKVCGNGNGVDNKAVPPIVSEEIVEDVFYVFGNGNGNDCETGNTGGENSNEDKKDEKSHNLQSSSISDGGKVPFKLGTIIDIKTDGKATSPQKSPTKKSRWDQKASEDAWNAEANSDENNAKTPQKEATNNKPMFFFGRGCFPFKSPTVSPSFASFGMSSSSTTNKKVEDNNQADNLEQNSEKNEIDEENKTAAVVKENEKFEEQVNILKPPDKSPIEIDKKVSITKPKSIESKSDTTSKTNITEDKTIFEKSEKVSETPEIRDRSSEISTIVIDKKSSEHKVESSKNIPLPSGSTEIANDPKEINLSIQKCQRQEEIKEIPKVPLLQTSNKIESQMKTPIDNSKEIIDDKRSNNKKETESDTKQNESISAEMTLDLSCKPKLNAKSKENPKITESPASKGKSEREDKSNKSESELDKEKVIKSENPKKSIEKVPPTQLTDANDAAEKLKTTSTDVTDAKPPVEEPICTKKSAYVCGSKDIDLQSKENNESSKISNVDTEEKLKSDRKSPNKVIVTIVDIVPSTKETSNENIAVLPVQISPSIDNKKVISNTESKKELAKITKSDSNEDKSCLLKTVESSSKEEASEKMAKEKEEDKLSSAVKLNKDDDKLEDSHKILIKNTEPTPINLKAKESKQLDDVKIEAVTNENKLTKEIKPEVEKSKTDEKTITEKTIENEKNKSEPKVLKEDTVCDKSSKIENIELDNLSNDTVLKEEKDPLEVSDKESEGNENNSKPMSLQTFSMDFNESAETTPPPIITRALRKRARDNIELEEQTDELDSKKMKFKGKRQVDQKLRKSVEEKKELICISSDDDDVEAIEIDDDDDDDEEKEKNKPQLVRKGRRGKLKKGKKNTGDEISEESKTPRKKTDPAQKNKRLLANLGITSEQQIESITSPGVRQSRRLAQLKIKEITENKRTIPIVTQSSHSTEKKLKKAKKEEKRKRKKEESDASVEEIEDDDEEEEEDSKKKKKRKKHKDPRKIFDEKKPWKSSSDDSSSEEGGEEEEEYEEEDEPLVFKSDHEFSPESDMENDADWQPTKRARTARKESDVEEEVDDCNCQKCGKSDHPEWILLCDKCDNGWHCSCLRPPLLVIPEGDWFCPPCQHFLLLEGLKQKLVEYDKKLSKKEIEDRRKERLAYVGISLNNVLPSKGNEPKKKRGSAGADDMSSGETSESNSESEVDSESDSDEPIYQLRQRKRAQSYKFNDYDEMIKSAIQDEMEAVKGAGNQGRGKDIANIVNAEREEDETKVAADSTVEAAPIDEAKVETPEEPVEEKPVYSDDEPIKIRKLAGKKKHRKLNSLDISSSDDGDSDEDFKGSDSMESEDEFVEDLDSEDSEDDVIRRNRRGKSSGPVRRSTRARVSRYDADFINDDTDDEGEPQKKKKRSIWDESEESEESDRSWGRRKRNKSKAGAVMSRKKQSKKKKKKKRNSDSDVEYKKKPRIKYGGLESSEEEGGRRTRTRGKKTTYVDTLGSDTDEDLRRNKNKFSSDEDEDFVANEDEEVEEDDKISEEDDEEEDEEDVVAPIKKKVTEKKPPIKDDDEDNNDEDMGTTIEQINKNLEEMDENEMEKMIEDEEYANKQLKMVALQLEKEKKRKEREKINQSEQKVSVVQPVEVPPVIPQTQPNLPESVQPATPVTTSAPLLPTEVPLMNYLPPQPAPNQPNAMLSNISTLIHNEEGNDELSEPPGVSLPLFSEIVTNPAEDRKPRKRRIKFTAKKKNMEETSVNLSVKDDGPKTNPPAQVGNIEIAAPPQPFSSNQPAPSVITRMLQSKPPTSFPVIRAKSFTSPPESMPPGLPPAEMPLFRPQFPHNYPVIQRPPMRGPLPPNMPPNVYTRALDPSPSGGGPINMTTDINRSRFPHPTTAPLRAINMMRPPYPAPPPGFYNQYPDVIGPPPSTVGEPGSFYEYSGPEGPPPPTATAVVGSEGGKYDEESGGGEFGGLVSYFSSQREDDLES